MNTTYMLITIATAIIAGVFASFIKPFVDWGIEKKRSRLENRKSLINNARNFVSSDSFDIFSFRTTDIYLRLSEYFSKELNDTINMEGLDFHIKEELDYIEQTPQQKSLVLKEINKVAKQWRIE